VSAVPEPASGLVLVLAATCMRRRRLHCATCPA
jgi:hypothetical protein